MLNAENIEIKRKKFLQILKENMYVATGCTEPGAISYCASLAATELKKVGDTIESIEVFASKNILKNAMSAGLPNTTRVGVNYAAAIGALHGDPNKKLDVNNDVTEEIYKKADEMINAGKINVQVSTEPNLLYIEIYIRGKSHKASAIIVDNHTNVLRVTLDGENVYENFGKVSSDGVEKISTNEIQSILNIKDIFEFCDRYLDINKDDIEILKKAETINLTISDAGMKNSYGLEVGKNVKRNIDEGIATNDMKTRAVMMTTAAADARMAGAPYQVVANSGSGNQGITLNVPVLSYAKDLNVSEEKKYKAMALANLTSIYIKSKFGTLSAFCGATVASTGAGCGIAYLLGGGYNEICYVIHNMVGTLTGLMCDGAKADCALKIYSGLETAIFAAELAIRGKRVQDIEGIVCDDVEDTINNIARVSQKCSSNVDDNILDMMLNKKK